MQSANVLGRGHYQLALEPSAFGLYGPSNPSTFPALNVRAQLGINERVDLGIRVGGTGIEILSKYQITDPASPGLILSVAPSAGSFVVLSPEVQGGIVYAQLPMLLGVPVGRHQLILGPKAQEWLMIGSSRGVGGFVNELNVGGTVGFLLAVTDHFKLLPEVGLLYPLLESLSYSGVSGTSVAGKNGVFTQVGLGVIFGN